MDKLSRQFSIILSNFMQKVLALVFGVGAVILPNMSSRLVWRIFCTPPASRSRNNQLKKQLRDEAKTIDMDYEHSFIRTYAWSHRSAAYKGKVALIHGWGSYALSMACLINPLRDSGYDVITFDSRAHGESPGRQSTLPEFVNILDTVVSRLGPVDAALAHSFGSVVITSWISESTRLGQPELVKKLILVSSPKGMKEIVERFSIFLNLPSLHRTFLIKQVEKVTMQPIDALAVTQFLKQRKVKVLLVHDRDDPHVPITDSQQIVEAIDDGELMVTSGLGHTRILCDDVVVQRVVSFLDD
jgi:pimeloyl-ACP methyl ester carboxylesterase